MPEYPEMLGHNIKYCYKVAYGVNDYYKRTEATLGVARLLSQADRFFYDFYVDWRGRYYTNAEYLSYQGTKLEVSLLKFGDPKPLGVNGLTALKIYGASLFGMRTSSAHNIQ